MESNVQKIAQKYNKQIELLSTQKELFQKMIESNLENLDRIKGIKKARKRQRQVKKRLKRVRKR